MVPILFAVLSILVFRFRSRAALELQIVALQHRFYADNAPADLSFHLWIGFYGCCSTEFGLRSSTRCYW